MINGNGANFSTIKVEFKGWILARLLEEFLIGDQLCLKKSIVFY